MRPFRRRLTGWVTGAFLVAAHVLSGAGLTDGLLGYLDFEPGLRIVNPQGAEFTAEFARASRAFTDEFAPVEEHEPRFAPGRFGLGVLVEPGCESGDKLDARNWLPPEAAEILPSADGSLAYQPSGDARLELVPAAVNAAAGVAAPVLEGTHALSIHANAAGSGAVLGAAVRIPEGSYTLSLFARSGPGMPAGDQVRLELVEEQGTVLAAIEAPVAPEWRRIELNAVVGTFTRDTTKRQHRAVLVRVLAPRAGQDFALDAVMLEMRGGYSYAGTGAASSWLPGLAYRASEVLDASALRTAWRAPCGSVAFWAQLRGRDQRWRTLFELASGNRWQPHLQLRLRPENLLCLGPRQAKPDHVSAPVNIQPGTWHHYAVTWTANSAVAYLDGQRLLAAEELAVPLRPEAIRLGSAGPNAAANAVLDEALFYDRVLDDAEIAALAARATPVSAEFAPALTIRPARFIATLAHGWTPQAWACEVRNRGAVAVRDLTVTFRLGEDLLSLERRFEALAPGQAVPVEFRFVADLALGRYPLRVDAVQGATRLASFAREVEITPAPEPFENLQVAPWQINADREFGFTFGCGDLEGAMRQGLYYAPHPHYLCHPRTLDGEDWVHDMNGKTFRASLTSPYIVAQIGREAERLARRLAPVPALRGITPNSEMQWLWSHDFSPVRVAWVRDTFGIDLNLWRDPPKGNVDAHQTPFGRLKPGTAGIALPEDRIVPLDEPFYRYHRWFHSPDAPTESFLNQTLCAPLSTLRPEVLTIQEPILRRPAVRAFDRMGIAQEWFYYENPMSAVMVQECLNAAVRGTPLRPSGMPQFLFKPQLNTSAV